jgi:hypothetical protein
MVKHGLAALLVAGTLGATAVAVAQQPQVNVYGVDGDVTPNKVGTKAKPVPVGLKVNYTTGEASGLRPEAVRQYTISFYGGHENTDLFPACTARKINDAGGDAGCPKGSLIGTGSLLALAGATSNVGDTSLRCALKIKVYNSGKGKGAVYLSGQQPECAITIDQALDAKYVDAFGGKGRGLQFEVPPNLLHPIPGISIAVVDVKTTLPRKTRRVKGKLRGYFESTEPCVKGERFMEVTFVTEAGQTSSARDTKRC